MNLRRGVTRSFILVYLIWLCFSVQTFLYDFLLDEDFKDCIEIGEVSKAELEACHFYSGADDYPSSARLEDLDTCRKRRLYYSECGDEILSNYFEDLDKSLYLGMVIFVISKFFIAPYILLQIILWSLGGYLKEDKL